MSNLFDRFTESARAYLALLFGILSLGFSAIFVRSAHAPGTVTAFYRMAIGSLVMLIPFMRQLRQSNPGGPSSRGLWLAGFAGIFFGIDLILWTTGIVMSGATIPTLMANTAPLWVGLGALLFFRERQGARFWFGLLVAMSGAAIVLGQDFAEANIIGMGSLFGMFAAFFYGAYYLVAQRARTEIRTLTFFWISTASAAILLLIVNLILRRPLGGYDPFTYGMFLAMGVLVQAMGWLAINYAQGYLPAAIVAPTLLGQPVVTAVIAWPLLGESLHPWQFLGGAAVLAGVYLVHRSRRDKTPTSEV